MKNKYLVAVTGGIGSGKSLCTHILSQAGYKTLSCDDITDYLYSKRKILKMMKYIFPDCIKGRFTYKIDRRKLANMVFNDKDLHKQLTDLITPLIMEEIQKRIDKAKGLIFIEVPLLFECHYENKFDKVLVIKRPMDIRIDSVMKRSDMTEQEVIARIKTQVDYDNMDLSPYTVINNKGDVIVFKSDVLAFAESVYLNLEKNK